MPKHNLAPFIFLTVFATVLFALGNLSTLADTRTSLEDIRSILTGQVHSEAEGPMEGVAVIAQQEQSSILTAVMTNALGEFHFSKIHLAPGKYKISIRAAGYTLAKPAEIVIAADTTNPPALDLSLIPVTAPAELAAQLTNLEWLQSIPGTAQQKEMLVRNVVNCGFCHSLARVTGSTHNSEAFLNVIQRMMRYDFDHTSFNRSQIGYPLQPLADLNYNGFDAHKLAEYLASINLSDNKTTWPYSLKTLPRPTGKANNAIVTVYPIPRQPSVIHDLDVDSNGNVWYGNTGWDFIGKLDPASGTFSEWPAPNYLPEPSDGSARRQGVMDIQVDTQDNVWASIAGSKMAMFSPTTEQWTTFDIPVVSEASFFISPFREGDDTVWTTGHSANPDGSVSLQQAFRLHIPSGKVEGGFALFDQLPPLKDPVRKNMQHYCYMFDRDKEDNFVCSDGWGSNIVRLNAATGKATLYPTPTPWAFPRRGYTDNNNRYWFTEFYADKIGVFDLNNNRFKEYPLPIQYISPYYARPDNKGSIWISSNGSDRLIRLDPETGETILYLIPVYYDARKVVVDRHATTTTLWLPNKNTAQLIRVEVPN